MGNSGTRLIVDGRDVADVVVADTWARRARGMLARSPLPASMWFVGETGVHGVSMTRSLDVALLDEGGRVVATTVLHPFGMTRPREASRTSSRRHAAASPAGDWRSAARWRDEAAARRGPARCEAHVHLRHAGPRDVGPTGRFARTTWACGGPSDPDARLTGRPGGRHDPG